MDSIVHSGSAISLRSTMGSPRITVITPSYNQGCFLEQTVLSVLQQDYPHVEYIIIDGGSSDESIDIIRRYSPLLAYWVSEKDFGQSDALNKGFKKATGDIFCYINSDDVLLPGALSNVANFFYDHPEAEVMSGGCCLIDKCGEPLVKRFPFSAYTLGYSASYRQFLFYGMGLVYQQGVFWRRSAFEEVGGFDPDLRFIMDLDLFTRLAKRKQFYKLPKLLAGFRVHDEAKSCTIQDVRKTEGGDFEKRYGVEGRMGIVRHLIFWKYRIEVILQKFILYLLRKLGRVKLERVFYERSVIEMRFQKSKTVT